MNDQDRLIQGMAWGGDFRILAAQTTIAVETARVKRDLSPIAAVALGRAMTGAVLLARLLDKQVRSQHITLRFDGNGPLGTVIGEGNVSGDVRGYVSNARYENGTLDVGPAVGSVGNLTIVRRTPPEGRPYTSQVELVSGQIAQDLSHYLAHSEQIASAVLLGVFTNNEGVQAAGGMIVQAFPHATPESVELMEKQIQAAPAFSSLLEKMSVDEAVAAVLHGSNYKSIDRRFDVPIQYKCTCTRERALAQFALFSPEEVGQMIQQDGGAEAVCQFCGERYDITADELLAATTAHEA